MARPLFRPTAELINVPKLHTHRAYAACMPGRNLILPTQSQRRTPLLTNPVSFDALTPKTDLPPSNTMQVCFIFLQRRVLHGATVL